MNSPVILEIGSLALKVHYRSQRTGLLQKTRLPWDLAREVYSTGGISEKTAQLAIDTIRELRSRGIEPRSLLAIATGALRDANNRERFLELLRERLESEVRVITSREEASLLAQGFLRSEVFLGSEKDAIPGRKLPALVANLGGGSLELVYIAEDRSLLRDTLPLGPIRLDHLGREDPLALIGEARAVSDFWDESRVTDFIAAQLDEASILFAEEVFATGGIVKTITKLLGRTTCTREDLLELADRVRREGTPAELSHEREAMLLPGILVLEKLLAQAGAARLSYVKIPIGRIFLERLAKKLASSANEERRRLALQDLRITSIQPRNSGVFNDPDLESKIIRMDDLDDRAR